ncbi:MAG TPA: DNA repair protein RecN [Spirochaetota bacterium]|nr:DNA repair protein RecN [Spirochaetota bacterium]HQO22350.1 DNA repair protein RecN [Spirochaetota bacterium]HQQ23307.1 DNA repair protein RecN [Spirochaetota bacterium]
MLNRLRIKNFVLIEDLEIDFKNGLNVLTGETGAGKSILIDAISAVLGDKMTTDVIRTGFERATIEGDFDIGGIPNIKSVLDDAGIECDDDTLVLRRELYSSGKGRSFANSLQIPVSKLLEIGESLIDIHGQNEHQNISKVAKHREILDRFAGLETLVGEVGECYNDLFQIKEKIKSTEMNEAEKKRRVEYLSFAVDEIEKARLVLNEDEALKEEETILSNSEKIFSQINAANENLRGDGGVIARLKKIEQSLSSVAEIDANIAANLDSVRSALYSLEDSSIFFRDYQEKLNFSESRINEVEERLSLVQMMKKKYGNTISDVLQFAETSRNELNSINSSDEMREKLTDEYRKKVQVTKVKALELSEKRTAAAQRLESLVMKELSDLNMQGTEFKISIKQEINPSGEIEMNNNIYMLYPHGLDKIEFLLSANSGELLQQLKKAASGGEMSRIMLALKTVLLSNDIVETLIFDEVDAGISGKTAEIVGQKLKTLAKERQVLVITHLPQIAAMSDNHFSVSKEKSGDRTFTHIKNLSRDEKITEVARMLAGKEVTELSRKHAAEMVALSEKTTA